jgi:DNA polymerase elongation subunit (family B)
MYPSIILTFNTSPDTKDPNGDVTIDDVKFKAKPNGFITETIKELYGKRLALKGQLKSMTKGTAEYDNVDSMQTAYKLILNSVYGVMAFKSFRFYDLDVAKSITAAGRKLIKYISTCIENNQLGKTLYGDTDSIFIQYDKDPDKILDLINQAFIPGFVKAVSPNSENFIQMELKDVYMQMAFFGKKKNYIAQIAEDDFLIRGLSTEKYDTPKPIRKIYDEIIPLLFNYKPFTLAIYEAKIRALGLNDLICLKKFNKNKEDYKVVPQHLKALRFSMKHLPLIEDTQHSNLVKMVYVIVDPTKFKGDESDTIIIDENIKTLPEGITINYDKYVEFFLYKKLEDVLKVFNKIDQIPPKQPKPRKPRAKKVKEPVKPDNPDNPLPRPDKPDNPLQPVAKQKIDDIF